jgi:hypothetical protein
MANDKFNATPVVVNNNTVPSSVKPEKIKSTDFLPRYHQTTTNNKFFNVTLDPLISKGSAEDINAYIGRKSGTIYKPATDAYVGETRKDREDYQFDIGAVSKNMDGTVVNKIAYADILKKYKTFTPSNLDSNFYSWDPAIDPDKFINFSHYHWLPKGLPPIEIKDIVDIDADINGMAAYTTPSGLTLCNGMRVFFMNNENPSYVSKSDSHRVFNNPMGPLNVSDLVTRNYTIRVDVSYISGGNANPVNRNIYVPEFNTDSAGKVFSRNWIETSDGIISLTFDGLLKDITPTQVKIQVFTQLRYFTVSGVGKSIQLLEDISTNVFLPYMLGNPEGFDTLGYDMSWYDSTPPSLLKTEYIVMQVNSPDNNGWSRANQWCHIDVIEAVYHALGQQFSILESVFPRAKRPIIEFRAGMQLMNHGARFTETLDLVADNVDPQTIIGKVSAQIDGVELKNKQKVLFINSTDTALNKIATVSNVGASIELSFAPVPNNGDTVLVKNGNTFSTNEFWFNGSKWTIAQLKTKPNQFPLFALYDYKGIALNDQSIYKSSNFSGNTVFQYKTGTFYDSELSFNVEYEESSYDILNNASPFAKNFANLKFNWTQNTGDLYYDNNGRRAQIKGNYYVKLNNRDGSVDYSNGWVGNANEALTFQRISRVISDVNTDNTISLPSDIIPSYEYQAYLEDGNLKFNIISKDGATKRWNDINKNLLFPIGYEAVIHNFTGLPFIITDGNHQNPAVVFNNRTTDTITAKFMETDLSSEHDKYMYYECGGSKGVIQLVDPLAESRSVQVRKNGIKLSMGTDFTLSSTGIDSTWTINIQSLLLNDCIEVLFVSNQQVGVYGTSASLEANPDNESIGVTSFSKMIEHFSTMIGSQPMVAGSSYGSNTWHDSPKGVGNGYVIQQQDNSLLLPALLLGSHIDPTVVLVRAGVTHASFRSKFISNLQQIQQQIDVNSITPAALVDRILTSINVGKNSTFANAYSGMVYWGENTEKRYTADGAQKQFNHGANYVVGNLSNDHIYVYVNGAIVCNSCSLSNTSVDFTVPPVVGDLIDIRVYPKIQLSLVPPSLAKLGIIGMRYPRIVHDSTNGASRDYIVCHDGTEITVFGDEYINNAILELERRIFAGAGSNLSSTKSMEFSAGAFRSTSTTWDDKTELMHQFYIKWASDNSVPDMNNVNYDEANPFTWNYPASVNTVSGSYRAIYQYLFDTDKPHTCPWEMLGYTMEPTWWSVHYAWDDPAKRVKLEAALRNGAVSEPIGGNSTHLPQFSRKIKSFPISETGKLLDPVTAGICDAPSVQYASSAWKFGEYGTQEMAWRRSASFQWAEAIWEYSVSPNKFFSKNFNTFEISTSIDGYQKIMTEFGKRIMVSEHIMHRQNGAYKLGMNQLIAEYIISMNRDVSAEYYQVVNNGSAQMMYKVGGYADKRTMRFKADTLKQTSGTTFIPEENFNIHLYKGSAYSKKFYSGVKVVWNGMGYEVSGYDNIDSYFLAYLPKTNSRVRATKFNNVNVLESYDFMTALSKIPYGTIFKARQEVYDFLGGLNKYMIEIGFKFDRYDETSACMTDFVLSGKQFMFWSESLWAVGSYIALSPMSEFVKFTHDYGTIDDYVTMADYNPIIDINGGTIATNDLNFDRSIVGEFTVTSRSPTVGVFGMAIELVEMEHIVVFDNMTTFGDTIYNPIYRLKQYRLKYVGQRTADWDGTTHCAGFLLHNDKIIGNFDRTISDISESYYGVEGYVQNSQLLKTARHSTGLQYTGALTELIDNQNNLFEFSKSLIRQKGTPSAYNKILRSVAIEGASDTIMPDEEWMFKLGEFGNIDSIQSWEFRLKQNEFKDNKQVIRFNSSYMYNPADSSYTKYVDSPSDTIIDIMTDDARWVHKPVGPETDFLFRMRPIAEYVGDTINAGYATTAESDFTAENIEDLAGLYNQLIVTKDGVLPAYRIWVSDYTSNIDGLNAERFKNQNVPIGWNMLVMQGNGIIIDAITPDSASPTAPPTITFVGHHNLMVGDIVLVTGTNAVDGIHTILSMTVDSVTIDAVVSSAVHGGTLTSLMPTRFATTDIMDAALRSNRYKWVLDQLIFIDSVDGKYATYRVTGSGNASLVVATPLSTESTLTDVGLIKSIVIYDRSSNRELIELDIYDPFKGFIPSAADRNIDIKSSEDPALYSFTTDSELNVSDISPWGIDQVGTVWWDLSTSKFMDYEQSSLEYRHSNWGRLFPNASVDVYQWIESKVPPLEYNNASLNATPIGDVVPVGSAKVAVFGQDSVYSYATRELVNSDGTLVTLYYFWVKGLDTISPYRMDKTMPVASIAATILNPTDMGIAWAAPISENALIVSGVSQFLNNDSTTIQVQFAEYAKRNIDMAPEVHSQWILLRENDSLTRVPEWLHARVRDSLAGFNNSSHTSVWTQYDETKMYVANDIVQYNSAFYVVFRDMIPSDLGKGFTGVPSYRIYDYEVIPMDLQGSNKINVRTKRDVPDYRTDVYDRYGNSTNPMQQTWIKDRSAARRTFIASANKLLATMDLFDTVPAWNNHLISVTSGTTQYDITRYYNIIDYVSPDFNELKAISHVYSLETDIDYGAVSDGDYVLIQNASRHAIYQLMNGQHILMFKRGATIQFKEELFNSINGQFSWDLAPWDFLQLDNEPSLEFSEVVSALRDDIFINEYSKNYNILFFDMVRYIFSENDAVDWIAKSSYLYIDNLDVDDLSRKPYIVPDKIQKFIDHINEIKPYRTKIRQVVDTRPTLDAANVNIEDSSFLDIETKYVKPEVSRSPRIQGGRFGMTNYSTLNGNRFGSNRTKMVNGGKLTDNPEGFGLDSGDGEFLPTRIPTSLSIEVVTKYNNDTYAFRMYMSSNGSVKYSRITTSTSAKLISPLKLGDNMMMVNDGTRLPEPDTISSLPASVIIDGEKIEYYSKIGNQLWWLRRGRDDTGMADHKVYSNVHGEISSLTLPQPHNNALMFNDIGKTLVDSTNRGAFLILKERGN